MIQGIRNLGLMRFFKMDYFLKPLSKDLWQDFENYFNYQGKCSGCWCLNHRLPIEEEIEGEPARAAMKALIEKEEACGLLAYDDEDPIPVGWVALDPKKALPGHDCIEEGNKESKVWSLHCLSVRTDHKKRGVEKFLVQGAIDWLKEQRAKAVEAYPEPGSQNHYPFKTWNTFNGTQELFENYGFEKIEKDFGSHAEFYYPMIKHLS